MHPCSKFQYYFTTQYKAIFQISILSFNMRDFFLQYEFIEVVWQLVACYCLHFNILGLLLFIIFFLFYHSLLLFFFIDQSIDEFSEIKKEQVKISQSLLINQILDLR